MGRKRPNLRELGVVQQGLDSAPLKPAAPVQELQLDQEAETDHGGPSPAYQLSSRVRCTPCRQHVIDYQDVIPWLDSIVVHL